eukprot:913874-Prymnesium_polylepis.2
MVSCAHVGGWVGWWVGRRVRGVAETLNATHPSRGWRHSSAKGNGVRQRTVPVLLRLLMNIVSRRDCAYS